MIPAEPLQNDGGLRSEGRVAGSIGSSEQCASQRLSSPLSKTNPDCSSTTRSIAAPTEFETIGINPDASPSLTTTAQASRSLGNTRTVQRWYTVRSVD